MMYKLVSTKEEFESFKKKMEDGAYYTFYTKDKSILPYEEYPWEVDTPLIERDVHGERYYFFNVSVANGELSIGRIYSQVLYEYDGSIMVPVKDYTSSKTYGFKFLDDTHDYFKLLRDEYQLENPMPRKTTIASKRVLSAWHEWLTMRKLSADLKIARESSVVRDFLIKARSVATDSDFITDTRGRITRGGVRFYYEIIDRKIKTTVSLEPELAGADFETFIKFTSR